MVCTPRRRDGKFLVTEDTLCLHEAPHDDLYTTKLHIICIVSPRLAVRVRHGFLSELFHRKTGRLGT